MSKLLPGRLGLLSLGKYFQDQGKFWKLLTGHLVLGIVGGGGNLKNVVTSKAMILTHIPFYPYGTNGQCLETSQLVPLASGI